MDEEAGVGVGADLDPGCGGGVEAGEEAEGGVVGVVGGGEELGEGEGVEGVGEDGGRGFGGQALGPGGGGEAVEELDPGGGVEGTEAADADQGGVVGCAEGPEAPAGVGKGLGAPVDHGGDRLGGDGLGVPEEAGDPGSFQWAWRGVRSRSETGVRTRRAVWFVGGMQPSSPDHPTS